MNSRITQTAAAHRQDSTETAQRQHTGSTQAVHRLPQHSRDSSSSNNSTTRIRHGITDEIGSFKVAAVSILEKESEPCVRASIDSPKQYTPRVHTSICTSTAVGLELDPNTAKDHTWLYSPVIGD
jgi:hypothetical protein